MLIPYVLYATKCLNKKK